MPDYPPVGCYGVTKTGGFWGWLIRLGTFSRYNHAFIVGPNGMIVEADPRGARFWFLEAYPNAKFNSHVVLDDATRARIWDEASKIAKAKIPYAWLDDFALGLKFFHISIPWVNNRIKRSDRLECAQLADLAYLRAGVTLFDDGRLPMTVEPGDLADLGVY